MGHKIEVTHRDVTAPQFKLSTDPDWQFHDEKCPVQVPDSAMKQWKIHEEIDDEEGDLMEFL